MIVFSMPCSCRFFSQGEQKKDVKVKLFAFLQVDSRGTCLLSLFLLTLRNFSFLQSMEV